MTDNKTLGNIQTLGFLAAMWVFFHHMQPTDLGLKNSDFLNLFIGMGFAGVDLFFVISGFIMSITTRDTEAGFSSAGKFLLRRFSRIYAGWWPFFFLYLAVFLYMEQIKPEHDLVGSFFLPPLYLQTYLNPVTWTLSFELYFYIALGLILVFTRRHVAVILGLVAILLSIFCLDRYLNGMYLPDTTVPQTMYHYFFTNVMIIEFIVGFMIGEFQKLHNKKILWPAIFSAIFFGISAFYYHNFIELHPSGMAGFSHAPERTILVGGFSVCIVLIASTLENLGISPLKSMQKLGNTSYSLYLGHGLLLFVASDYLVNKLHVDIASYGIISTVLITIIAILVS